MLNLVRRFLSGSLLASDVSSLTALSLLCPLSLPLAVDKIFELLSSCAALHPPPSSSTNDMFNGLDPDSLVYADADGNIVGPGLSAEEEEEETREAGRVRSDFVNQNRHAPY